jgi:hypothetical protein
MHTMYIWAKVTVSCPDHGWHAAEVEGPMLRVVDLVATFTSISQDQGRQVITEYKALPEPCELRVGEWD